MPHLHLWKRYELAWELSDHMVPPRPGQLHERQWLRLRIAEGRPASLRDLTANAPSSGDVSTRMLRVKFCQSTFFCNRLCCSCQVCLGPNATDRPLSQSCTQGSIDGCSTNGECCAMPHCCTIAGCGCNGQLCDGSGGRPRRCFSSGNCFDECTCGSPNCFAADHFLRY